ncbi:MAG: arginase family protein [Candidatus Sungiibacteriota bacterium]
MRVLKVGYDAGGGDKSYGARFGPDAIERQFKKWPWRVSEDGTAQPEAGFVDILDKKATYINSRLVAGWEEIAVSITGGPGVRSCVVLSGDNSVSFRTALTVSECYADPHLVVLDAHPDACDDKHDLHASWVRRLWENGAVRPEKTIFFGIRDAEADEMAYVREKGAVVYSCDGLFNADIEHIVYQLKLSNRIDFSSALILVVDIDVVDPSQAPATGVPRAPGLDTRQVLRIIRAFGELPFPAKVGEIAEVIPAEGNQLRPPYDKRPDPCGLTVLAAEAILREMLRSFA